MLRGRRVYISIATIRSRILKVVNTLISLLENDVLATHIYVIMSRDPYLLDDGIPPEVIPDELHYIAKNFNVSMIYTENLGPHRKLLPVLAQYWEYDCVIITIDDDKGINYPRNTISQLIKYYISSRMSSVISLRGRRIGVCEDKNLNYTKASRYMTWPGFPSKYGAKEMLVVPTGTGGVLYHPRFFHPIVFDETLRNYTYRGDDLHFRLSTMINHIYVVGGCRDHPDRHGRVSSRCPKHTRVYDFNQPKKRMAKTLPDNNTIVEKPASLEPNRTLSSFLEYSTHISNTSENYEYNYRVDNNNYTDTTNAFSRDLNKVLQKQYGGRTRRMQRQRRLSERDEDGEQDTLFALNKRENDIMWNNALNYLKSLNLFDFSTFLATYAAKERQSCLNSTSKHYCGLIRCRGGSKGPLKY